MERIWVSDDVAVSVERIDFHDPALADDPDARERGVRVEVRPVRTTREGSVYASATTTVAPGTVRYDLLESRPGAADRMHWHPSMSDGEPGGRVFDEALSADPLNWLGDRLSGVVPDLAAEIVAEVGLGLAWARLPWPDVTHDDRGLATG